MHIGTGNQKQPEALYPEEAIIPKTTKPKRKENNKDLILLLKININIECFYEY